MSGKSVKSQGILKWMIGGNPGMSLCDVCQNPSFRYEGAKGLIQR